MGKSRLSKPKQRKFCRWPYLIWWCWWLFITWRTLIAWALRQRGRRWNPLTFTLPFFTLHRMATPPLMCFLLSLASNTYLLWHFTIALVRLLTIILACGSSGKSHPKDWSLWLWRPLSFLLPGLARVSWTTNSARINSKIVVNLSQLKEPRSDLTPISLLFTFFHNGRCPIT